MRTVKRLFVALMAIVVVSLLSSLSSLAAGNGCEYLNEETCYGVFIEDDANLIREDEVATIVEAMKPITNYGHVMLKTINNNGYGSTPAFADAYYHAVFGTESGTMFLIDMDCRNIWIFSDGEVYKVITTGYANTITDNIYTYASDGEYGRCAERAFEQIATVLEGNKIAQPMKWISNTLIALLFSILINFSVMRKVSKAKAVSDEFLAQNATKKLLFSNFKVKHTHTTKVYDPPSDSSSSGGGGGGGGSSGGGGGHSF